MRRIPLTRGKFAFVDDEDYARVSRFNWQATPNKDRWYAIKKSPPRQMHRLLMRAPRYREVDHVNGDGLDNRRSTNLRFATRSQQTANSRVRWRVRRKTSRYKGVCKVRDRGRLFWRVCAKLNGKHHVRVLSCRLHSEREAARLYNEMARRLFGVFARLNPV